MKLKPLFLGYLLAGCNRCYARPPCEYKRDAGFDEAGDGDGSIHKYNFTVTQHYSGYDGHFRSGYFINGMSPGPLIEGNEGDWVNVTITNCLPVSFSIHFHGMLQRGTPWSDGVPGITQYPIPSGKSHSYVFKLDLQWGPAWYHAHYRGYQSDGLYGPMYIRPKLVRNKPYDLVTHNQKDKDLILQLEQQPETIMVNDHFKYPMDTLIARMKQYGIEPMCIQSILVNGKGRVYCHDSDTLRELAAKKGGKEPPIIDKMGCFRTEETRGYDFITEDLSVLDTPGYIKQCQPTQAEEFRYYTNNREWQYLNIINAGGQFTKAFSIDDHEMVVIAVDGMFVRPQKVHQLVVPVGTRYTILVETRKELHQDPDKPFKMRFAAILNPQFIEGIGYLFYGQESNHSILSQLSQDMRSGSIENGRKYQGLDGELLSQDYIANWPHYNEPWEELSKLDLTRKVDRTLHLYMNRTGVAEFSMFGDGTLLPMELELIEPLLHKALRNKTDEILTHQAAMPPVYYNETVDIVVNNFKRLSHPVHLHGHLFHLVSYSDNENFGFDTIDDAIRANSSTVNLKNPPNLDLIFVPPSGHAVLRVVADNPGIWLLHCHNLGHLLGGMGAIFLESIDRIKDLMDKLKYLPSN